MNIFKLPHFYTKKWRITPKFSAARSKPVLKIAKKAKTYLNLSNINSAENDLAYVNFKKSIFSPTLVPLKP